MMPRISSLLLLATFLCTSATAQPTLDQIIDRATQAHESMMSNVDSYLITMDMFGMEHQTYYERIEGGGPLDFRAQTRMRGQTGWMDEDADEAGDGFLPTSESLARLRQEGRFAGQATVNGQPAYAITVDDPSGFFDVDAFPEEGEFDLDEMTLYIDASTYFMVGFDGKGTMVQDGRATPITMEMRSSDFRTVGPMTYPFVTSIRFDGFAANLSPEERRQLEEAKRQMEQMPAQQREMMRQMMGDQLEQIERMAAGEALEMEMRVRDLQVNVPRPN